MESLAIVAVIASIGLGLANLGCTIYVVIKLYQENGILHALFGFFCCQLYPFIWGWINASRLKMYDVMIFWTAMTIFSIVLQVVTSFFEISSIPLQ